MTCDNEPSTKSLEDAVIQACVGVEVFPKSPLEGALIVSGRVEIAVREVKRQCRTTRISSAQQASVRMADDTLLLSWLIRFSAQVMNE